MSRSTTDHLPEISRGTSRSRVQVAVDKGAGVAALFLQFLAVLRDEVGELHKHSAGAAGRLELGAAVRFEDPTILTLEEFTAKIKQRSL